MEQLYLVFYHSVLFFSTYFSGRSYAPLNIFSYLYNNFTNSIENFFSILKSGLQKLEGLKYEELKINIAKVIREIPKEKYKNIIRETYKRPI